ncbi:TatD-related deoxyribonuclease [uncultured Paludibacter sp.]|nr:TatD-related deoxyribonuclease [uncultured Paludibacter sp.]
MKLVDIHTHNKDIDKGIISVHNISLDEFGNLTEKRNIYYSLGIHPYELENSPESKLEKLKILASDKHVKLIGECGLDKNIQTTYEKQLFYFKEQISISEQLQKPLIIHCVGYFNELFELRKELKPTRRWIIHGFRSKPQLAQQALNAGFDISFGEKFNAESVKITPVEHLFIETDESKISIAEIYQSIARIKNCLPEQLNAGNHLLNC